MSAEIEKIRTKYSGFLKQMTDDMMVEINAALPLTAASDVELRAEVTILSLRPLGGPPELACSQAEYVVQLEYSKR